MAITASRILIPLLGVGALLLYRDHPAWVFALAGVEVLLAVVGGSARAPSRLRVWALPTALFLAGTAVLFLAGWWGGAIALYVAGVAVLAITVSGRAGLAGLTLITIVQMGYGLLVVLHRLSSAGDEPALSLGAVAVSLAATLLAGGLIVAALGHLTAGWNAVLADARKETQEARDRGEQLADRIDALLATQCTAQQRISYLEAGLAATQQLSALLGPGELLNRAAVSAASHFGYDEAQLYLLDSMGEWATLMSTSRPGEEDPAARGYRLHTDDDTLVGWVASHRQARVEAAAGGAGADVVGYGPPDVQTILALPMEAGGRILGVLVLLTNHEVAVGGEDLGVLQAFADYLARLIDHARGVRDEAAASEVGGPFLGTADLLVTARTEADVYDVILDVLRDAGPARVLVVRTMDDDEPRVVLDYRGQQAERVQVDLVALTPSSLGDLAFVGLALESPLWAEDLTNLDPSLSPELGRALQDLVSASRSAGLAVIPLRAEATRVEGEIIVLYGKAHRFSSAERRLHQLLVDFGGAALERTRLLAEAQGRLSQAQQRSVIEARIARAAGVETILKVAVRELARALRAADGEIRLTPGAATPPSDGATHCVGLDQAKPGI